MNVDLPDDTSTWSSDKLVSVVCGMACHEQSLISVEMSEAERARYLDAF